MTGSAGKSLAASDQDAIDRIAAAVEADTVKAALEAARERLGMDVAYLTTIGPATQTIDEVSAGRSSLQLEPGQETPLEFTYCQRMLCGAMPNVVPDTSAEPAVQGLPVTRRVGSYVGVPTLLADGSVHGTLCCASADARPDLGDEELRFMQVLAGMVGARVDKVRAAAAAAAARQHA